MSRHNRSKTTQTDKALVPKFSLHQNSRVWTHVHPCPFIMAFYFDDKSLGKSYETELTCVLILPVPFTLSAFTCISLCGCSYFFPSRCPPKHREADIVLKRCKIFSDQAAQFRVTGWLQSEAKLLLLSPRGERWLWTRSISWLWWISLLPVIQRKTCILLEKCLSQVQLFAFRCWNCIVW